MRRAILVVGGSGQVGRRLVRLLAGENVVAPPSRELSLADHAGLIALCREHRFDVILIPGAARHIDWCEEHPEEAFAINAVGPGLLAQEARVVYFSTDAVFDGKAGPYRVEDVPNPISVYGRSKLEGERRVLAAGGAVLRTCHIFSYDPGENFLMDVARRLRAGRRVVGYTDQWSTPTDADALAEEAIRLMNEGAREIVNLAGRDGCTRYEFACEVARAFGLRGVEPGLMTSALRPRQTGLASGLMGWREGILRQQRLSHRDGDALFLGDGRRAGAVADAAEAG